MTSLGKLPVDFYTRKEVDQIARELLGKILATRVKGAVTSGVIVETEAYGGPEDKASHAHGNRRTVRTESMFQSGGHAYVYLCYGIHRMFNVVTGPVDYPAAVLIRAVEPLEGVETMLLRRKMKALEPRITAGPGALAEALGITLSLDRENLSGTKIWIEDRGRNYSTEEIVASPRVGVHYAGEHSKLPRRYRVKGHPFTSPAK